MLSKLRYHLPTIVTVAASLALLGLLFYNMSKPSTTKSPEITISNDEDGETKQLVNPSKQYDLIAEQGDSYTLLARKTIQNYAKSMSVRLSPAQIIAAETILTQNAGSPLLEVGQKVNFKNDDLKSVLLSARSLTAEQLSAWQAYVPYVQF